MLERAGIQVQFLLDLVVPLEQLDGVPPQEPRLHLALDGLLDMGDGVLHAAGKDMGQFARLAFLRRLDGQFRRLAAAFALEGADLDGPAAQFPAQALEVDLVAVLAHQVDHVHRHDHRDAQFDELGGQVEVALDVGAVDDVQDGVGLFPHQVAAGHHFLQRVGREGIDAGQVLDDHVVVALEAALLLFHRDAGPVAHVLVGAGQIIEQRSLAAVRVAGQCDLDCHCQNTPFSMPGTRRLLWSLDFHHGGVGLADAQFIVAHRQFQRVAQRGHFAQVDRRAFGEPHVHDAPPHRTFAMQPHHSGMLAAL